MSVRSRVTRKGELIEVAMEVSIASGWHINSSRPLQEELIATALELPENPGWELVQVTYPPGVDQILGFQEEPLSLYTGELAVVAMLRPRGVESLDAVTLELGIQACDDRACLRPESLSLRLALAPVLRSASLSY